MRRASTICAIALLGALAFDASPSAMAQDAPQNARPGECYGRARLPGETHVWRERVQTSRGGAYRRTIPAERRWTSERVLVKAAWSEAVKTPAVYRTVYDRVTRARPRLLSSPPPPATAAWSSA